MAYAHIRKSLSEELVQRLIDAEDPDDIVDIRDQYVAVQDARDLTDLTRVVRDRLGWEVTDWLVWLVSQLYSWEDEDFTAWHRTLSEAGWNS